MTVISGVGRAASVRGEAPRAAASGFAVPSAGAGAAAGVTAMAAMPGLLAMQEAGQGIVRDREARRHATAMLDALAELQRALLGHGGPGGPGGLDRLVALVRAAPEPSDPTLASLHRAVLVRAAVELARRAPACGSAATVESPFATGG